MEFNLFDNKITKGIQRRLGTILCFLIILGNILYELMVVTDFSLSALTKITSAVIIYILSVWLLYILSQSNGITNGKETEVYISTMNAYHNIREETYCMIDKLSAWCKEYVLKDLKRRRTEVLVVNDVPYDEYGKYKGRSRLYLRKQGLLRWQRKAIKKADRIKPYRLNANLLVTSHEVNTKDQHAPHPAKELAGKTATHLTRYAVCGLFIVNLTFAASYATDIKAVLVGVLARAISMLLVVYSGYKAGYFNQTVTAVNFTREQTEMLTMFKKETE